MPLVSIIIPSRLKPIPGSEKLFVERAIECVYAQTAAKSVEFQIIIGIDAGQPYTTNKAEVAEAPKKSLSSAINAAASKIIGDYVAFLEDDDLWKDYYLELALSTLTDCGFVSSTQLERDTDGNVIKINDFATPCTWVMHRKTWDEVGQFNEDYPIHQDNEWLGRLGRKKIKRIHLVEATAPTDYQTISNIRPWLEGVLKFGGPASSLRRHASPWPLVDRLVHPGAGMSKILTDPFTLAQSNRAYEKLIKEFGCVPW